MEKKQKRSRVYERKLHFKGFIAEIPPTKVGEKGLLTLTEFSKRRNSTHIEQYLKKL